MGHIIWGRMHVLLEWPLDNDRLNEMPGWGHQSSLLHPRNMEQFQGSPPLGLGGLSLISASHLLYIPRNNLGMGAR